MARNLLGNLKTDRVYRIDVNFEIPNKYVFFFFFWNQFLIFFFLKRNIEAMIGRAAHI